MDKCLVIGLYSLMGFYKDGDVVDGDVLWFDMGV